MSLHREQNPHHTHERGFGDATEQDPVSAWYAVEQLIERFGTEVQCEVALVRARWPSGFVCPECGESAHSTFLADGRRYWQCAHCRTQTTVRSGTLFHASKLPLTVWFQAIYLVTQNKSNLSALSLKRHLGVCYRTAWRVKHKLLEAMAERESRRLLTGVVLADDAYLGGVRAGKPGRGSTNKVPFMAAVESTRRAIRSMCASTRSPI